MATGYDRNLGTVTKASGWIFITSWPNVRLGRENISSLVPNPGLRGDDDYFTRNAMFTFLFVSCLLFLPTFSLLFHLVYAFHPFNGANVGKTEYTGKSECRGKTDSIHGCGFEQEGVSRTMGKRR